MFIFTQEEIIKKLSEVALQNYNFRMNELCENSCDYSEEDFNKIKDSIEKEYETVDEMIDETLVRFNYV